MMQHNAVVQLFRSREAQSPDETVEFSFASAAREYARNQINEGKARRAVVRDRDGKVIETFPA